ncbi:DUF2933 domain-containing protein [Pseudomonas sp. AU11447]|uniref:DUF2933 domain-containing protein n=2 Tax=Pseudomonas TaxID=286 RepID=UPI003532062B
MMPRFDSRFRNAGRANWFFLGFLAIAGYFLITEHQAHVVPYLPFLLLLACPLMHLLMHGGHGHGEHAGHVSGSRDEHGAHGGCGGHRHSNAREEQQQAPRQQDQSQERRP